MTGVVPSSLVVGTLLGRRRPRRTALLRATSDAAMQLARSVRSGATLPEAVAHTEAAGTGPDHVALRIVQRALQRGVPVDDALVEWERNLRGRRDGSDDLRLVVAAARFGSRHGGDVASALESAALALLDRAELAEETAALASQSRASAAVLCVLPLMGAATMCALDADVAVVLLRSPLGWGCVALATLLDAAAFVVSELLVRRALR